MSAQTIKKNDRSKLVEQDFGRRLYATDKAYSEAMKETTQKYMDSMMLIKQSEFEKPYLEDDYGAMEYAFESPNPPDFPTGPGWPIPDCNPKCLGAWGALGSAWELCAEPDPQATVYLFSCCHKIVRFSTSDRGLSLSVAYIEGDQCVVTITGVRGKDRFILELETDKEKLAELIRRVCCPTNKACGGKCEGCPPPTIGYTSQQMACGGVQALTHSGGGAGGKYTWSTDYGTFDSPVGAGVNFTAPAANAECANNPTITLTDCCGHTATLKIANSCVGTGVGGYLSCCVPGRSGGICRWIRGKNPFNCDGTFPSGSTYCNIICGEEEQVPCTVAEYFAWLVSGCTAAIAHCNANCSDGCAEGYHDTRTPAQKTAGCCPQQLLT